MNKACLILLFFMFLGSGCAKTPVLKTYDGIRKDPTELQINAAKNGNLTCEFAGECEPSVALISVATAEGISRCTGFLISDHQILTNDHCLSSLPNTPSACKGIVFSHFTNNVHRSCKSVSFRSMQNGIASKDYAIIELDLPITDRIPLKISRESFKNNEVATIYLVQPTQDEVTKTYNGIQNKIICQANFPTLVNVNISNKHEPLMSFGDCAIHEGSSGSPIINKKGEIGAIAQGYLNVNDDEFSKQIGIYLLDESYGQVAIGTQMSCIPELVGIVADRCNSVKPISPLYPKQFLDQYGSFKNERLPKLHSEQIWMEIFNKNQFYKTHVSAPACIPKNDLKLGKFSFTSKALQFHLGINSKLQAEWRLDSPDHENYILFSLKDERFISSFGSIVLPICK